MQIYLDMIERAETLTELYELVNRAAYDETLTGAEYCRIYGAALDKARGGRPE